MSDELELLNPLPDEPAAPEPAVPVEPAEPEPEGVVDVSGQKMVPLSALKAERQRLKETHEREKAPLVERVTRAEQIAQQREQELNDARRPPVQPPEKSDPASQVSDDDAEKFAKHYELFTPTGLDTARAKRMIADNRTEITRIAQEAATQAVAPVLDGAASVNSKNNFIWAASQKGPDGQPLVDPRALAEAWVQFPPKDTANPEVAQVILNHLVGQVVRTRKAQPAAPGREPLFSEPSSGRPASYTISAVEKKMATAAGISTADWEKTAKTYERGVPNSLE